MQNSNINFGGNHPPYVYTSKFYLTNFICQRYFARVDDKFVTSAFEQKLAC